MNGRKRVIVVGSVNVDLVVRAPQLPTPGETVLGGEFAVFGGGKGANQAVAAARAARDSVTFVAAVGDDAHGRDSLARFRDDGLVGDHISVDAERPTGVALIMVNAAGENMISVASGANLALTPECVDAVSDEVFATASVLLVSCESPLETVIRALERAKRHGLTTIVNPAPADPRLVDPAILRWIDVLTPNEVELAVLTAATGDGAAAGHADPVVMARQLCELGCGSVVVTLGKRGCMIVSAPSAATATATAIEARRVEPVDTTAAGDAFNGALAVALAEGRELEDACRWANAAAALSVARSGAQPSLANREAIDRFLIDGEGS
jgi:ribokinase